MQLPPNPSLANLKKQAKSLLKAHRQKDPTTVGPIRTHLPRLAGATDEEILAAEPTLQEIQLVVAREYGFSSWPKLVAEVEQRAAEPGAESPQLFTSDFKRVYSELSRQESARLGNNYVGTEHMLLALLKDQRPHIADLLTALRLDTNPDRIARAVEDRVRAATSQPHGDAVPYTPRAKAVMSVASREAQALGDEVVQAPHLLLALLKDPESLSAQITRTFSIGYAAVLAIAEDNPLPRFDPQPRVESDAPSSAGYQRVVEQARSQAMRLKHNYIGTEHLLLALLDDAGQRPIDLLTPFGLDPQKVSQSIEDYVSTSGNASTSPTDLPYTPRVRGVFRLAREECAEAGAEKVGIDHLLLALCLDEDGVASQILATWGVSYALLKGQADDGEPPATERQ